MSDLPFVGTANAFLGEMRRFLTPEGVHVAPGFAVTAYAYHHFVYSNDLGPGLRNLTDQLDGEGFTNLPDVGREARKLIYGATFPKDVEEELFRVSETIFKSEPPAVFVRGCPVWEDNAWEGFPGHHSHGCYVVGYKFLPAVIKNCYAALYSDHAIRYREENKIRHDDVAMPVGIQKVVQGERVLTVLPGAKSQRTLAEGRTFTETDTRLIRHCLGKISKAYPQPLEIEWIKEERTDMVLLLQVRPQVVHISHAGFPENV